MKQKNLCKASSNKIIEIFQDGIEKQALSAGPIFCEPLNAKIVKFPETIEGLNSLIKFQEIQMKIFGLEEMSINLGVKSSFQFVE